jgi:hypothetical protein
LGRETKHIISILRSFGGRIGLSVLARLVLLAGFWVLVAIQNVVGQAPGDYQTIGDVTFNNAANWQRFNGISWVAAGSAPTWTDGVVTIHNGHTATVNGAPTIDQTIVESGAILFVNSGQTLQVRQGAGVDLTVNGTLTNSGDISKIGGSTVVFGSNSFYEHAQDGGIIRSFSWDPASTCKVSGIIASVVTGLNQNFGNFLWDCPNQTINHGIVNLCSALGGSVSGDFTVKSTGASGIIRLYQGSATVLELNISGNMNIEGGLMYLSNSADSVEVNIGGDFNLSAGEFRISGSSSTSNDTINLQGDFNMTGGTLTELGNGAGTFQIVLISQLMMGQFLISVLQTLLKVLELSIS